MKRQILAAGFALVSLAGSAVMAGAADLYQDNGPRYGSAYDDPRYADLYGRVPAPYDPPRRYEPDYARPPIPKEPIYRDDYRYRRYSDAQPPRIYSYNSHSGCTPKDVVSQELRREGWTDLHEPRVMDQETATVRARRAGRLFELRLDRCSGDVLASRPLEPRYGPYADYGSPRYDYRY